MRHGTPVLSSSLYFLPADSQSSAEILAFDWSQTDIGAPQDWPLALKIAVGIMLASKFPKAIAWGPGLITIHNDAFRPILGDKPLAIGRSFADVWADAWQTIAPIVERTFDGESTFIENFPMTTNRHGYAEEAHFTFCYSPIRDEHGAVAGMMDTVIEVSETVATQRRMQAVNSELAHRMQNMLAMVSSIASQTLRGAADIAGAQIALQQRLVALGQAQHLLTTSDRAEARITDIIDFVRDALSVDPAQLAVSGPSIWLADKQALSLSLAINELMTNSIKYGALSSQTGRVSIAWTSTATQKFHLRWTETGGPVVQPPSRKGFGSTLLERIAPADFHGEATLAYRPEGVSYELRTDSRAIG